VDNSDRDAAQTADQAAGDCKQNCICDMCQLRRLAQQTGGSKEELLAAHRKWAQDCMLNQGWYAHYVFDAETPTGFCAHTHGLLDTLMHWDLQIIAPLPGEAIHAIFHNVVERIKQGKKYKAGSVETGILNNGYNVKFVDAWEGPQRRAVLRIILPDPDGALERGNISSVWATQYADLQQG
jgi:hypothetical protein